MSLGSEARRKSSFGGDFGRLSRGVSLGRMKKGGKELKGGECGVVAAVDANSVDQATPATPNSKTRQMSSQRQQRPTAGRSSRRGSLSSGTGKAGVSEEGRALSWSSSSSAPLASKEPHRRHVDRTRTSPEYGDGIETVSCGRLYNRRPSVSSTSPRAPSTRLSLTQAQPAQSTDAKTKTSSTTRSLRKSTTTPTTAKPKPSLASPRRSARVTTTPPTIFSSLAARPRRQEARGTSASAPSLPVAASSAEDKALRSTKSFSDRRPLASRQSASAPPSTLPKPVSSRTATPSVNNTALPSVSSTRRKMNVTQTSSRRTPIPDKRDTAQRNQKPTLRSAMSKKAVASSVALQTVDSMSSQTSKNAKSTLLSTSGSIPSERTEHKQGAVKAATAKPSTLSLSNSPRSFQRTSKTKRSPTVPSSPSSSSVTAEKSSVTKEAKNSRTSSTTKKSEPKSSLALTPSRRTSMTRNNAEPAEASPSSPSSPKSVALTTMDSVTPTKKMPASSSPSSTDSSAVPEIQFEAETPKLSNVETIPRGEKLIQPQVEKEMETTPTSTEVEQIQKFLVAPLPFTNEKTTMPAVDERLTVVATQGSQHTEGVDDRDPTECSRGGHHVNSQNDEGDCLREDTYGDGSHGSNVLNDDEDHRSACSHQTSQTATTLWSVMPCESVMSTTSSSFPEQTSNETAGKPETQPQKTTEIPTTAAANGGSHHVRRKSNGASDGSISSLQEVPSSLLSDDADDDVSGGDLDQLFPLSPTRPTTTFPNAILRKARRSEEEDGGSSSISSEASSSDVDGKLDQRDGNNTTTNALIRGTPPTKRVPKRQESSAAVTEVTAVESPSTWSASSSSKSFLSSSPVPRSSSPKQSPLLKFRQANMISTMTSTTMGRNSQMPAPPPLLQWGGAKFSVAESNLPPSIVWVSADNTSSTACIVPEWDEMKSSNLLPWETTDECSTASETEAEDGVKRKRKRCERIEI